MKVIIESTQEMTRSGVSQKSGKPYSIREQKALLDGARIRGEIRLPLDDNQPPYEVGEYDIDFERSISIGQFGDVRLIRLQLTPRKAALNFPKTGTGG